MEHLKHGSFGSRLNVVLFVLIMRSCKRPEMVLVNAPLLTIDRRSSERRAPVSAPLKEPISHVTTGVQGTPGEALVPTDTELQRSGSWAIPLCEVDDRRRGGK